MDKGYMGKDTLVQMRMKILGITDKESEWVLGCRGMSMENNFMEVVLGRGSRASWD